MQASHPAARRLAAALCLLLGAAASACSGIGNDDRAGLACIDDSPDCIDARQATLKSMLDDQDRKWVREPSNAHAHASGVRLFAFRTQKKDLSCEQLAIGRREAESVPKALKGPDGKGMSPAQISRTNMLAAEVSKELAAEMRSRRCKA
ncbi:MAG TPA: hypothetical protein VJ740_15345 [Hyphomicrobiaceae bacterium]|nr:hypothetical protein [Hyphomicrobiaceae bacterium]